MSSTIHEAGPGASADGLNALEQELGVVLPAAYRAHLQMYDGGYPDPNAFLRENNRRNGKSLALVSEFLRCDELRLYREIYTGRMPGELLAVAHDPGGNAIVIATSGKDVGAVSFWAHEAEHTPPTFRNVYRIADDFAAFLDALHEPSG
jgi:hypothetical protein